jgi:predicted chitinase
MDLDSKIRAITKKINAGLKGLKERSAFTKEINESFSETFGQCMGE